METYKPVREKLEIELPEAFEITHQLIHQVSLKREKNETAMITKTEGKLKVILLNSTYGKYSEKEFKAGEEKEVLEFITKELNDMKQKIKEARK